MQPQTRPAPTGLVLVLGAVSKIHILSQPQFPAQSNAALDEQKVFGLWENGDDFDKVSACSLVS